MSKNMVAGNIIAVFVQEETDTFTKKYRTQVVIGAILETKTVR